MELITLQRIAVDALEDIKAQDIKVYDTMGQSSEFDRVIVASGTSNRQTRALAWNVVQKIKDAGGYVNSVEGADTGEWVLVDLGDIVIHLMVPAVRAYYALEEIWGAKPVRAKEPEKKPAAKKAAAEKSAAAPVAKKAAKKAAAKKAPTKKAASKSAVKKTATKKTVVKKAAVKKVTQGSAAKKTAPAKTSAKKAVPQKTAARKTSTKAVATKRSSAKK